MPIEPSPHAGSSPQARGTHRRRFERRGPGRFIPAGAGNTSARSMPASPAPVHPRRRGEHSSSMRRLDAPSGSSPQARGTPAHADRAISARRFIPAGAGNTADPTTSRGPRPVHPRRRGEHPEHGHICDFVDGSSPQARGTRDRPADRSALDRFIPAGAGNTPRSRNPPPYTAVHPRRRGEHLSAAGAWFASLGSSPQARGTLRRPGSGRWPRRFIPAGAGNTDRPGQARAAQPVHPRRRGEHARGGACRTSTSGSSPQARGTPSDGRDIALRGRFIPAGAGNTRGPWRRRKRPPVHPRRRGEHRRARVPGSPNFGSSPQARGTHHPHVVQVALLRFIPAGAGNTTGRRSRTSCSTVHPRRRGEHAVDEAIAEGTTGSSPQARGTRPVWLP